MFIFIFINCFIPNPKFDSQLKNYLSSNLNISNLKITDKFIEKSKIRINVKNFIILNSYKNYFFKE